MIADDTSIPNATRSGNSGRRKVQVVVYDFDGTCINLKSPFQLTLTLLKQKRLHKIDGLLIGLWGLFYKLHIPISESWARELVFRAFSGYPKNDVDTYLRHFYDDQVADTVRPALIQTLYEHKSAGRVSLIVSASFEPIVIRMLEFYPFNYQLSTRMAVDSHGCYTNKVEGLPMEGEEKIIAVRRFCNMHYGEGNWELAYAYSDHSSDRPLLYAANQPVVVAPDKTLRRCAKREGWSILSKEEANEGL